MAKKKTRFAYVLNSPIFFDCIYPNNEERLKRDYPDLVNDKNLIIAKNRFATVDKNLSVVDLLYDDQGEKQERLLSWCFEDDLYEIIQHDAIMYDGNSTPINAGDISAYNPHNKAGAFCHDILTGLFHSVSRRKADLIYREYLKYDGCSLPARALQYFMLFAFSWKARKIKPCDHWNYGRVSLRINGRAYKE